MDVIPQGTTLQSDLITALMDSIRADSNYVLWAKQQIETNCAYGTSSSYWQTAYHYDLAATQDKKIFNDLWTQVAGPSYPSYPTF